jgi:hypothetical protein
VDRFGRTEQQHHPAQGVFDQAKCDPEEGDHALIVPQRLALSPPRDAAPPRTAFLRRKGGQARRLLRPIAKVIAKALRPRPAAALAAPAAFAECAAY